MITAAQFIRAIKIYQYDTIPNQVAECYEPEQFKNTFFGEAGTMFANNAEKIGTFLYLYLESDRDADLLTAIEKVSSEVNPVDILGRDAAGQIVAVIRIA